MPSEFSKNPAAAEESTIIVEAGTENEHVERGSMREGKKEGIWQRLRPDGTLWTTSKYHDGELNGVLVMWSDDGRKTQEQTYRNDALNGPLAGWHPDGATKAFEYQFVRDMREGPWSEWYPDGTLKGTGMYKANKLDSYCTFYLKNGHLDFTRTGVYVNGVKVSDQ